MKKLILFIVLSIFIFGNKMYCQNSSSYNSNPVPVNGPRNSGFGVGALAAVPVVGGGNDNAATGFNGLNANTTGSLNTANGSSALESNTSGSYNTAVGDSSLYSNISGEFNTGIGSQALFNNTGSYNTAIGRRSLWSNSSGLYNTAIGHQALVLNTTGNSNTAGGLYSMRFNTTGFANTAYGVESLYSNTLGSYNAALGVGALVACTTGSDNTACGGGALVTLSTGTLNSAVGRVALNITTTGIENCGFGGYAMAVNTTGSSNTAIGTFADVSTFNLTNASAFGYGAIVNASNKVRIGDANVTVVEIDAGAIYTGSDSRFKFNYSESDVKGLDFIKRLRPVVYNFDTKKFQEFLIKNMPDSLKKKHMAGDFSTSTKIRHTGFVAQEVEQAAKASGYNFDGVHVPESDNDNYSLAYSQFVVPLVKAVQEQQKMIENLQTESKIQQSIIEELRAGGIIQLNIENNKDSKAILQNEPNPFSGETTIKYKLETQPDKASIKLFDLSGKLIQSFLLEQKTEGSVLLKGDGLEAGIYIYCLVADGKIVASEKLIIEKN